MSETVRGRKHRRISRTIGGTDSEIRMCDLIDLNSPDVRAALEPAKLASPLIPVPKGVECDNGTSTESATEKREGNNPFDRVLHETAEYVSKKGDPFEVMLQRALRSKDRRNVQPVDFTDDFTPRRKKRFLKMNKTLDVLDESLFEGRFGLFNRDKKKAKIETLASVGIEARSVNVCDDAADNASVAKQEHETSVVGPDTLELSILNQSAMNDTLLEVFPKSKENGEVSRFLETDASFEESIFPPSANLKPPNIQRSLSQGAGKSPTGLLCPYRRSQSVTDGRRKISQSDNSTMSFLDRGFLESRRHSERSVFSSLSNVSSITKLTSASLSSVLSNDPMNHAFLDDCSLKTSQEKISTNESPMEIKLKQYDLSDLAERFNKLKCTMSASDTTSISSITEDDSNSTKGESSKQTTNNKLIDVDVFVPEQNKVFNRSSSSTCSSDSVFTSTSKVDKSILNEAKVLAQTFELALKTESGSNTDDDLISNNTLWMSELLPAFEDEPVVDNLIDLPVSSKENSRDSKNNDKKQSASIDSTEENLLKEMELPFSSNVSAVKQNVTSLLSDLRKLVKAENNPEAKKLLDNLENILDVNYNNNTELLVTYLNISNKSQSPQKIPSDSERSDKSNTDQSEEESDKISSQGKLCTNEKLPDVNYKSEDTSQDIVSSGKSSVTSSSCRDNSEDHMNITNVSDITEHSKEKDNQVDKKIAVELLVNLQKLLSGQAEDDTTIHLLKNIGKALNTALNNNIENKMQVNCTRKTQNVKHAAPVRAPESGHNVHSSALSTKVAHRRSLEQKSKTDRKSVSAIESSPKSTSSTQIRRRKDSYGLENRQKRFSSDPGFINNVSNKKMAISEANNIGKAETTKPDSKKEKSIAISDVKNKLKKRSAVVNKTGPMKAVHPVDNMQKKRASLGRKTMPSSQVITPPKSNKTTPSGNKIISSTPNSMDNNYYVPKKPTKSKPMASSTPDGQNSKSAPLTSANKKRNLSCDISPVTTHVNTSGSDERRDSPKRMSKLPTPKKCTTPKRQQTDAFGIPKFLTPPRHSSSNVNNLQSPQRLNRSAIILQSPQRLNKSSNIFQRYSPASEKKNVGKIQQSPLKEANRITAKVKPLNLISKIKRHSTGDFAEKENNYA